MKLIFKYFWALPFFFLALSSCKETTSLDLLTENKGSYFSTKQYIIDEWQTHAGEPLVFTKMVRENGKRDSSVVNVEHMNWPEVLKPFIDADISDKKFLNKYTFTQFDDGLDNTKNFMYQANKEELFVQKLLITMDLTTNKVRGLYIETFRKVLWGSTTQKLYYTPARTIQIQEYKKPLLGSKQEKITQYEVVR